MPRSFLVKKTKSDSERVFYNGYKIRDVYDDSDDSLKAIAPYTPSIQPLAVRLNNGKLMRLFLWLVFQTVVSVVDIVYRWLKTTARTSSN